MSGRRSDTREKIQSVALELFAERGYDQTSLREIAERLSVTKAALYYHFKSKEDIVVSLFKDVQREIDAMIAWGERQPRTLETRQELIRRFAAMTRDQGGQMIRFMQDNRPGVGDPKAIDDPKAMDKMRERFLRLAQLVTDPKAPLCDQLRARLAFTALNTSGYILRDLNVTDEECDKAALAVAIELITGCPKPAYEAGMKS